MKTLLLLRHAKAVPGAGDLPDFERPLAPRGRRNAQALGCHLRRAALLPQVILCSTAVRTRQTAEELSQAGEWKAPLRLLPALYDAGAPAYREALKQLPGEVETVMLVGHNPVIEALVHQFSGEYQPMPTCALAVLDVDVAAWETLGPDTSASLRQLYRPKEME